MEADLKEMNNGVETLERNLVELQELHYVLQYTDPFFAHVSLSATCLLTRHNLIFDHLVTLAPHLLSLLLDHLHFHVWVTNCSIWLCITLSLKQLLSSFCEPHSDSCISQHSVSDIPAHWHDPCHCTISHSCLFSVHAQNLFSTNPFHHRMFASCFCRSWNSCYLLSSFYLF